MVDYLDTAFLDYAQINSRYSGVAIDRHAWFVDNHYFLLADELRAAEPHNYVWQLHGEGIFADLGMGNLRWTAPGGAELHAHVTQTGSGGVWQVDNQAVHFEFATSSLADLFYHTAVRYADTSEDLTYLAALWPWHAGLVLPTIQNFTDGQTFSGILITYNQRTDILLAKHPALGTQESYFVDSAYTGVEPIASDASLLFISTYAVRDSRLSSFLVRAASYFVYDGRSWISDSVGQLFQVIGDAEGDFDVDRNDIESVLRGNTGACGQFCDLDGDGAFTVLDARRMVALCSRPRCAVQ